MDTEVRPNAPPRGDRPNEHGFRPPLLLIFDVQGEERGAKGFARASALAEELARNVGRLRSRCSSIHVVVEGDPVLRTTLSLVWRTIASRSCRTLPIRIHPSVMDAIWDFLGHDGDERPTTDEGQRVVP